MEIKSVRRLGKTKDQIVINDHYVYKLKLRKEKERICLTAKRIGYTTKGVIEEVKKKRRKNENM